MGNEYVDNHYEEIEYFGSSVDAQRREELSTQLLIRQLRENERPVDPRACRQPIILDKENSWTKRRQRRTEGERGR